MDPLVAHQRAQDAFSGVLGNVKPHQLHAPTPCEEWTVRDLIEHVIGGTNDALVHAWDLAKATGQPTDLDPELATSMLASSRQHMTDRLRGSGNFFGEPQPCGRIGRQPISWPPSWDGRWIKAEGRRHHGSFGKEGF